MKNEKNNQRMKMEDIEVIDFNEELTEMDEVAQEHRAILGETNEKEKKKENFKELLSLVFTFAIAMAITLLIKNYVIINANVPTGSMENTIMPGDNLFGYRLAYVKEEPQRGDIIFFYFPDDETQKYVKRIIGLPGERVYITNGKIYIGDSSEPLDEPYLKEEWIKATGTFDFEVPEDSYLVLGDNRNNSLDSRFWINPYVHEEKIIGKALFVYYPFDRIGGLE